MKRNKLAAGALALALGLSAVAPSFAADTTSTKTEVKSTTMFQEKYAAELEKAQELYKDATAKKARLDKAEVAKKEAEDAVLAAAKKYSAIKVSEEDKALATEVDQARRALAALTDRTVEEIEGKEKETKETKTFDKIVVTGDAETGYVVKNYAGEEETIKTTEPAKKDFFTVKADIDAAIETTPAGNKVNPNYSDTYTKEAVKNKYVGDKLLAENGYGKYISTNTNADGKAYGTNDETKADKTEDQDKVTPAKVSEQRQREFEVAYERYVNAWNTWNKTVKNRLSEKDAAYQELIAAERAYDVAVTEYKNAKKAADPAVKLYEEALRKLKAAADAYNVVIVANNNGIEVKGEDEAPAKDKITDEQLAKLQETVKNARETLKAVEILKQFMPNTSTANIEKLDKIAAEQRVALEKAEKILKANNITASLFSTAYAAEEEATSEDVDALIDELETNDKEMKDLMKEIDKDAKKDDEKPADDDKKDDDKKDDDKKDDEKPADDDKKDDKKPAENKDNKKDTTKVVDRTANKKAGSNAKTGIAGVAGVAGVLAAASVAYAASKKNN